MVEDLRCCSKLMSADMAALYGLGRDVDTWSEKLEPERLSEGGSEALVKRTEYPTSGERLHRAETWRDCVFD